MAHGREAVRVQLAVLRQAVHAVRRVTAALAHAHRREAFRVPRVQQAVHAVRPPGQARQNAQRKRWQQEGQQ